MHRHSCKLQCYHACAAWHFGIYKYSAESVLLSSCNMTSINLTQVAQQHVKISYLSYSLSNCTMLKHQVRKTKTRMNMLSCACAAEPPAAVSSLEQIIQSMQQIKAAASLARPTLPPKGAKVATPSAPPSAPPAFPKTDIQQRAATSQDEQPSASLPTAQLHHHSMHARDDTGLQRADEGPITERPMHASAVNSSQQQTSRQSVKGVAVRQDKPEESRSKAGTVSMDQPEAVSTQQDASTAEPDQATLLRSTAGPDQATPLASTSQVDTVGPQPITDGKAVKDSKAQKDSKEAKEKRSRGKEKESSKSKHGKKDKRSSRGGRQRSTSRSRSPKRYGLQPFLLSVSMQYGASVVPTSV